MSDRIYGRYSSDILINLSEDSVQNKVELKYLREYKSLHKEYLDSSHRVWLYENSTSNFFKSSISIDSEISICNQTVYRLSVLESSQPIQDILNRERKYGEEITMEFCDVNCFSNNTTKPKENNKLETILCLIILGVLLIATFVTVALYY